MSPLLPVLYSILKQCKPEQSKPPSLKNYEWLLCSVIFHHLLLSDLQCWLEKQKYLCCVLCKDHCLFKSPQEPAVRDGQNQKRFLSSSDPIVQLVSLMIINVMILVASLLINAERSYIFKIFTYSNNSQPDFMSYWTERASRQIRLEPH